MVLRKGLVLKMGVLLTQQELSEKLKVEVITLYKLRKMGMPYIRLGQRLIRYDFEEVEKWLKSKGVRV